MNGWGRMKQQNGFTVIELLIVIIVIGILVALIFVGYGAVASNAKESVLKDDISKLADAVKLKALDLKTIPDGGRSSSETGDATTFSVRYKPSASVYDVAVANLFYCAGLINGSKEFGIAARAVTGKAYSYRSDKGASDFTTYTGWSEVANGVAVCQALGFSDPFTWSYGFTPTPGWHIWSSPT